MDEHDKTTRGSEAYILFRLAEVTYGIASRNVQQIEMLENITAVPDTPAYIQGVMFSRGQVIPVINLRKRLGLPPAEFDIRTRVIIVKHNDRVAGLIADTSREYIRIPDSAIQPAPELVENTDSSILEGIARTGDRIIMIFSIPKIMNYENSKKVSN